MGNSHNNILVSNHLLNKNWFFFKFHPHFFYFKLGGHLGWKSGSPDTIWEGGHPRIIPQKFGCNWSFKNLVRNHVVNVSQTLSEWSLGGPLSKLCPSAPSCIQDGAVTEDPRIISAKFGWDWISSFREEDFFKFSSPLFSNMHNRSKSAKVRSS
jgi:hypothetical protein